VSIESLTRQQRGPSMTAFDKFTMVTFRIFATPATRISRSIPLLRENILRSNLRITPEGLVAVALFSMVIAGLGATAGAYVGFVMLGIPYFLALYAVVPLAFIIVIYLPRISASNRGSSIDNELPFVVGYISVLAGGGISPLATLRRIASMDLFPAAKREAKRILLDVDVFGQDPITAIEHAARWSPSKRFSEFLFGYTSTLKSGGDFLVYVQSKLKDTMENKAAAVKRSADTTGTMAEAYLTVTVILGMVLYTLYMVQALISSTSGGLASLYLWAFIVVPLISGAFAWLIDAVQPKWPYVDYRPFKYIIVTAPVAVIFLVLPLPAPLYLRSAIALIIGASLPAFTASRYGRERRGLEKMLPEFIRDVAEGRKTGLSPEVSIERLGGRHYGILTKHVNKMGAQLSWGVSLAKVVSTFANAVGSWITKAIGTLLIEVVDVGGGTSQSFSDMADFTRSVNEMESERRASLRPFVFITYISGVMVVVTTFIMVYLLAQPIATGFTSTATTVNPGTIDLLFTAAIFDTFVIGILAGKMGESGIADGFKHAIALVVVSLVAIYVVKLFISIPV
jgi:archaeal flagellar protein FlaJ